MTIAKWTRGCVGTLSALVERYAEALEIQQTLAVESAVGADDGFVHEERGECLLALGPARRGGTVPSPARYELLSNDDWLAENEPDVCNGSPSWPVTAGPASAATGHRQKRATRR